MAQSVGRSSLKPKGCRLDSGQGQGTNLGCWFCPWSGSICEAAHWCFSLPSIFLSVSLSLPSLLSKISKHVFQWGLKIEKEQREKIALTSILQVLYPILEHRLSLKAFYNLLFIFCLLILSLHENIIPLRARLLFILFTDIHSTQNTVWPMAGI